jgi:hypothetical protein
MKSQVDTDQGGRVTIGNTCVAGAPQGERVHWQTLPDRFRPVRAMVGLLPSGRQVLWVTRFRWGPICRQPGGCCRNDLAIQVCEGLLGDFRALDASTS